MARKMLGDEEVVEVQTKGTKVPEGFLRVKLAKGPKGSRQTRWILLTPAEYRVSTTFEGTTD